MAVKKLLVALLATLFCFENALSETQGSKGTTDGTFAGIERGDYAHLLVKTAKGQEESFFILRPDKTVQAYLDNPDKLKGRRIRVYWEERNEQIPEAGGRQRIKLVTKVDART